eukprot:8267050-Pyramimonas_sp.AAC.1
MKETCASPPGSITTSIMPKSPRLAAALARCRSAPALAQMSARPLPLRWASVTLLPSTPLAEQ